MNLNNFEIIFLNSKLELKKLKKKFNLKNKKIIIISSRKVKPLSAFNYLKKYLKLDKIDFYIELKRNKKISLQKYDTQETYDYLDEKMGKLIKETIRLVYDSLLSLNSAEKFYFYDDIDLLNIERQLILEYFHETFSNYFILKKIIKKEKPTKIIYPFVKNLDFHIYLKDLCKENHVKYEFNSFQYQKKLTNNILTLIETKITEIISFIRSKRLKKFEPKSKEFKDKVLFFCITVNHIKPAISIIKKIKEQNELDYACLLPRDTSGEKSRFLINEHINFFLLDNYKDYIDKKSLKKYLKLKKFNNYKVIRTFISGLDIEPRCQIRSSIIKKIILLLLSSFFTRFKFILKIIILSKEIIRLLKPKLIVIFTAREAAGNVFIEFANRQNIKSLYVPHAQVPFWYTQAKLDVSYMAATGDIDIEVFRNLGTADKVFFKTGQPKFDDVYNTLNKYKNTDLKKLKQKISKDLNLNPNKDFILLTTSPYSDRERTLIIESVLNSMKSMPNYELVIKLHPNESPELANKLIKKHNAKWPIIKNYNLYELLLCSKLLISRTSGTEFEAMLLDKDVIDMNFEFNDDVFHYVKYNAVIRVTDSKSLLEIIQKIINDKETKKSLKKGRELFIKKALDKFDGKGTERIYDLIKKIVNMEK
ncbi:MAG: UDP-N-acetylglucosamine 2-epimerase [Candidatus Helarchaeota archaeon]